jgi:hypothetical protein
MDVDLLTTDFVISFALGATDNCCFIKLDPIPPFMLAFSTADHRNRVIHQTLVCNHGGVYGWPSTDLPIAFG